MKSKDEKKWSDKYAQRFLVNIGLEKGQTVLDFGCKEGNHTIAAAKIVGEKGRVYAIDKEGKSLTKTMNKVNSERLKNVVGIIPSNELQIPLRKNSVDVVLLYDVLHKGFFPEADSRKEILNSIYQVLRQNGFVSTYLTHLRRFSTTFKEATEEIENIGFVYSGEHRKKIIHDGKIVQGQILTYRKKQEKN